MLIAGDQLPLMLLFEIVGNTILPPVHICVVIVEKTGTICGFTTIFFVIGVAQFAASGVKV